MSPAPSDAVNAAAASGADASKPWTAGTLRYDRRGLARLFGWLLWGDFAWNLTDRAIRPLGQLMLRQFGASDFVVGLLVGSIPSAIGFVLSPVVSVWSDRHRGPRGRRIPFLLIPTPLVALAMVGLAYSPACGRWLDAALGGWSPGEAPCRLLAFGFFWTAFELAQTTAQSVIGALINDVVPRPVIGRFFGLFRAVSLAAAIVFNLFLIGHAETHYRGIFLGLAVVFGLGFSAMCLFVKEGEYPPPPPRTRGRGAAGALAPIFRYFRECFAHPFYRWVFIAMTLAAVQGAPISSFNVFYAKSLGLSMTDYGRLLVVTYVISFFLSLPLGWLADRVHPLRAGLVILAVQTVMTLLGAWGIRDAASFGVYFVANGVIAGAYYTVTASLAQRLFPASRFAQFASAGGLPAGLAFMAVPPAMGLFLDLTGNDYRWTFVASGLLLTLASAALLVVERKFRALGGPAGYTPPE